MEQRDENVRQIDQTESNGASMPGSGDAAASGQSRRAADAYDRARTELQNALSRLRSEIEQVDVAQARLKMREWVRENPELASLLAMGGGLLLGRLVSKALTPAPPPSMSERLRSRADLIARQAQSLAEDVAAAVAGGAVVAGGAMARRARKVSEQAQDASVELSRRARRAAGVASKGAAELGDTLAERARTLGHSAAELADTAAHTIEKSATRVQKDLKKRASRGGDYAESMLDAARTIVAAAVIKRVNDWIRR